MRKRRNFKQEEERNYPESPQGLVFVAANNRPFAERLVGVIKLAQAGVKKDEPR